MKFTRTVLAASLVGLLAACSHSAAVRRDPGPGRFGPGRSSGPGSHRGSGCSLHRGSGSGFHRDSGSGFHRDSGSGRHGQGRRLSAAGFSERPNRPRKRPVPCWGLAFSAIPSVGTP